MERYLRLIRHDGESITVKASSIDAFSESSEMPGSVVIYVGHLNCILRMSYDEFNALMFDMVEVP